mmetsp:Transcript_18235/g.32679  ORF Transcript_18235/g.32679 Transcript_18235/m.32679 type:complete len:1652 (-) Transcript_18235:2671-7626(-)
MFCYFIWGLIGLCLLLPYLIVWILKSKLKTNQFALETVGFFSFCNLRVVIPEKSQELTLQIRRLGVKFLNRKLMVSLEGVQLSLVEKACEVVKSPKKKLGGLSMLIVHILSIILSKYIEVNVLGFEFRYKHLTVREKFLTLGFDVDFETAVLKMNVKTHSSVAYLEDSKVATACSLMFEMTIPPNINLIESLVLSTAQVQLGVLHAKLTFKQCLSFRLLKKTNPSDKSKPLKAPKLLTFTSVYSRVLIEDVWFEADVIEGKFKLPKQSLGTIVCKQLTAKGNFPILEISQVELEIIKKEEEDTLKFKLDNSKLTFNNDLALFVRAAVIADRLDKEPKGHKDRTPIVLEFDVPEVEVFLSDLYSTEPVLKSRITKTFIQIVKFGETQVKIDMDYFRLDSVEGSAPILRVKEPKVKISNLDELTFLQEVEFSCKDVRVFLREANYFKFFPAMYAFADPFKKLKEYDELKKKKPKPDVHLNLTNILIAAYFEPDLGAEVRLSSLTSNINQRTGEFELSLDTTAFSFMFLEKFDLLWFETVKVLGCPDAEYKNIEVEFKGVDFILPPEFQIGIGFYKAMKRSTKLIKWTEDRTSNGESKLKTIPLLRINLRASEIRFVIDESPVNKSIRKKECLIGSEVSYESLKNLTCGPFMLMSAANLQIKATNQGLQSAQELLSAMQDLDSFTVPDESFFKLLCGFNLQVTVNSVICQMRDYPYKFFEAEALVLKGRFIISKNKFDMGGWATVKRHYKIKAEANGCEMTIGLCLRPAMIDLACHFERMVLRRDPRLEASKSLKFKSMDQMRYSNHGYFSLNLRSLNVALLNSLNPHEKSAVDMTLHNISIEHTLQRLNAAFDDINIVFPTFRPLLSIPRVELSVDYLFTCVNHNHWLKPEEFNYYKASAVKVSCTFNVLEVDGQVLVAAYEVQQASLLTRCLGLLICPPIIFLQTNMPERSKKDNWLDFVEEISVDRAVIQTPRLLLITAHGTGLQITVDNCNFTALFERNRGYSVLPWIMKDAEGQASNIHMKVFDGTNYAPLYPPEFQAGSADFYFSPEHTLMTCLTVDYVQNKDGAQHSLDIQGFRLLSTKTFCDTLAQLLIMDPKMLPKLKRRQHHRTVPTPHKVMAPEVHSEPSSPTKDNVSRRSLKFQLTIHTPQISLQNESSLAQMLIISTAAKTEIYEEVLPYDRDAIDLKRSILISFASMETFVAPGMIDLGRPVFWLESTTELASTFREAAENFSNFEGLLRRVFIARDFQCNIEMFRLPYYYYNFALNTISQDKHRWNNEMRTNKVEIILPDLQCSMESEHAWTVIDVIQNILVQRDQHPNESVNELAKTEELEKFGVSEVSQWLMSRSAPSNFMKRARHLKHISVSAPNISLRMTKNCEVMLAVELKRLTFTVDLYSDSSSQKVLEFHRVDVCHNGHTMLKPLVPESESYMDSNCMFTLRLVDKLTKGRHSGLWQILDHVEVFLFPLFIDITPALYNDIYEFFFPKITELDDLQKEALLVPTHGKPKLKQRNAKKLKPLNKRKRLPGLFKLCHVNEIKLELTVRGWIGINSAKLTMEPFKALDKFWTSQEMFDKYMIAASKSVFKQVPSIFIQSIGHEKKDFLPTRVSNRSSFFNLFKKKKAISESDAFEEAKKDEDNKNWQLMFGTKPF